MDLNKIVNELNLMYATISMVVMESKEDESKVLIDSNIQLVESAMSNMTIKTDDILSGFSVEIPTSLQMD